MFEQSLRVQVHYAPLRVVKALNSLSSDDSGLPAPGAREHSYVVEWPCGGGELYIGIYM
jgi:hypothetical protein